MSSRNSCLNSPPAEEDDDELEAPYKECISNSVLSSEMLRKIRRTEVRFYFVLFFFFSLADMDYSFKDTGEGTKVSGGGGGEREGGSTNITKWLEY